MAFSRRDRVFLISRGRQETLFALILFSCTGCYVSSGTVTSVPGTGNGHVTSTCMLDLLVLKSQEGQNSVCVAHPFMSFALPPDTLHLKHSIWGRVLFHAYSLWLSRLRPNPVEGSLEGIPPPIETLAPLLFADLRIQRYEIRPKKSTKEIAWAFDMGWLPTDES